MVFSVARCFYNTTLIDFYGVFVSNIRAELHCFVFKIRAELHCFVSNIRAELHCFGVIATAGDTAAPVFN